MECLTDSLHEVRYILFLKSSSFQRGDIVAIQGHREDHVGSLKKWPYSKRILGVPGDHIVRNKGGTTVIPQESYFLSLLDKTSTGKPLTPLISCDLSSCNQQSSIIPEGYLFVAGDNPKSFDSRYAEFGLVPINKIWGKAWFVW
jgi:signal peptidase I